MRFLELRLEGRPGVSLAFDEHLTVVAGLDPAMRARLRDALSAAAAKPGRKGATAVPGGTCLLEGARALPATAPPLVLGAGAIAPELLDPARRTSKREEIEALLARRQGVRVRRDTLASRPDEVAPDTEELEAALAAVRGFEADRRVAEAERLARSIEELRARLSQPCPAAPDPAVVETARARYERAQQHLADAEAAARGGVNAEDAALIDRLHSEVSAAEESGGRHIGGAAARRRLAEARKAEAETLERLGFATYSDYLLDTFVAPPDPAGSRKQLDAARKEVKLAEPVWRELAEVVAACEARHALEEHALRLSAQAVEFLGAAPGDDLTDALRRTAEDADTLVAHLCRALRAAGVEPGDDPAADATTWLADVERKRARRQADRQRQVQALDDEVEALETEIRQAEQAEAEAVRNPGGLLEAHLSELLATRREVRGIGAEPLVVDDVLIDATPEMRDCALAVFERMGQDVQVIYLTADPEIETWALRRPGARVAVRVLEEIVESAPAEPAPAEAVRPAPKAAPAANRRPASATPTAGADAPEAAPSRATPRPKAPPAPAASPSPKPAAPRKPAAPAKKATAAAKNKHAQPDGTRSLGRCPCGFEMAVGRCERCRSNFCDEHLVLTKSSKLCVGCALTVAGVRPGGSRSRSGGSARR